MGYNGVQVAMDIQDIFENNGLETEVLAAIDSAIDAFVDDFEGLVGEGRTMADC